VDLHSTLLTGYHSLSLRGWLTTQFHLIQKYEMSEALHPCSYTPHGMECRHRFKCIFTLFFLLLLLRWLYSPMQTFTSLMDFSHSSLLFDFSFQFSVLHLLISVGTQFNHLFLGLPLSRCPWGLLLNTWLFFYYPFY
jgi:hypothetical protein